MGTEIAHIPDSRGLKQDLPAGHIDVSGNPHKRHQQAVIVGTIDLLFNGHPPLNGRRLGGRKQMCGLPDFLFGDPGDFCNPVQRVLVDPLDKRFPAVHEIFHKFAVVERFIHNHIQNSQGKGGIRSGSEL